MADKVYTVIKPVAALRGAPDDSPAIDKNSSQLLYGEDFRVEDDSGTWLFGTSLVDGYQGYVNKSDLYQKREDPTHFVDVRLTRIYPDPDFKTHPLTALSFLSRIVSDGQTQNGFLHTPHGWIFESHVKPMADMKDCDPVETAFLFEGTHYLYGGRSANGIDCSGLVQLSYLRNGKPCPRDSDQQTVLGTARAESDIQAGDLVFFEGHVGIMIDESNILNANSRTMDTRVEKLSDLKKIYKGITSIRRDTAV